LPGPGDLTALAAAAAAHPAALLSLLCLLRLFTLLFHLPDKLAGLFEVILAISLRQFTKPFVKILLSLPNILSGRTLFLALAGFTFGKYVR
jgi:hypothetical protein